MRWVVELPAASGGTGTTVTVDGESWKSALANARSGKQVRKFRCDFGNDGTVRVQDLETRQRFVLRQLQPEVAAKPASEPEPEPAKPAAPVAQSPQPTAPAAPMLPPPPSAETPPATPAVAASMPAAPAVAVPLPAAMPEASPYAAPAKAPSVAPPPGAQTRTPSVAPPPARATALDIALPAHATQIFQRGRDPDAAQALTFRERVLAVTPDVGVEEAERIARSVWSQVRASLVTHPPGQFVSIAVFDHVFQSRPERAPLVVLTWKDWRGEAPDLVYPAAAAAPSPPVAAPAPAPGPAPFAVPAPAAFTVPAPAAFTAPAPAPAPAAFTVPAPAASPVASAVVAHAVAVPDASTAFVVPVSHPPAAPLVVPAAAPAAAPSPSAPVASSPPAAARARVKTPPRANPAAGSAPKNFSIPPPPSAKKQTGPTATAKASPGAQGKPAPAPASNRGRGDELLSDAFEAMQDLAFLDEPDEACAFVATVARDLLHAPGVMVSVYDIDKDELVLRASEGTSAEPGRRARLAQGGRGRAAITLDVVTFPQRPADDAFSQGAPEGPTLLAPATHDRRLFGIVELHRDRSSAAFDDDEQHAAAYVSGLLGKFLAEHSRRVGFEDAAHKRRR